MTDNRRTRRVYILSEFISTLPDAIQAVLLSEVEAAFLRQPVPSSSIFTV
jgi:hypothetical protein